MKLYQLLLFLLFPVLLARLWLRDSRTDRSQRLALGHDAKTTGAIWLHGASNGELTSAKALIEKLSLEAPVLVTCNNPTGRDLVQGWTFPNVNTRLAPLDYPHILRRFLKAQAPRALVVIENEIWPNRIQAVAQANLPIAVVSARLSEGSARNWARHGTLARHILGAITLFSAQDSASEARFLSLGLQQSSLTPPLNLKTTITPAPANPDDLARIGALWPREKTVLAASTHPGEEEIVLEAFKQALQEDPGLRLILAPRHPNRREQITRLLTQHQLNFAARSVAPSPTAETQVFLADSLGEMSLWYALSGTAFIGGSLVPQGGHTPFEPAHFGCALLHGPHLDNFRDAYDLLQAQDASLQVTTASELSAAILRAPEVTSGQAKAATDCLEKLSSQQKLDDLAAKIANL